MTILIAILVFSALIFIHELGHYLTARLFDVHILEFAIGMGPKLLSRQSKKTGIVYSLRLLPFGGYVSMVGEDDEGLLDENGNPISQGGAGALSLPRQSGYGDEDEPSQPPVTYHDPRALSAKPVWQRMIITAAGATMNLLLGVVLSLILVFTMEPIGGTVVGKFADHALSAEQGLQVGDVITHVNGDAVRTHMELAYAISHDGYEPVEITVVRGAQLKTQQVTLEDGSIGTYVVSYSGGKELVLKNVSFGTMEEQGIVMGYQDFSPRAEAKTFSNVMAQTFGYTRLAVRQVVDGVVDLVTGRFGMEQMSGPVGVTQQVSKAAAMGVEQFLFLVLVITVNLGVFNLLPIPALDGGRLFFQLIELVFRKPIPAKWEGRIHLIGLALLLLLMVVITGQDIIRIFAK